MTDNAAKTPLSRQPTGGPVPPNAAKAATLLRVENWKNRLVIGSAVVFSATAVLASSHQVGSSVGSTASAAYAQAPGSGTAASSQGFFSQGGANGQQSYGFGSGGNLQAPVAATGVS